MDNGPLVNEEIAAGAELVRRFNEVRPVKVAFWLRLDDEQFRYLCIASDEVGSILEGYQDLAKAESQWTSLDLDPMRIRVIRGGQRPSESRLRSGHSLPAVRRNAHRQPAICRCLRGRPLHLPAVGSRLGPGELGRHRHESVVDPPHARRQANNAFDESPLLLVGDSAG